MKKILLAAAVIAVLASCNKKEEAHTPEETTAAESAPAETPEEAGVELKEWNADQISDFLKTKQNDTIYVTNFFATWCTPCMREIPFFKEKMDEMKGEKIKFTFVNLDERQNWDKVKYFAKETGLDKNIVLFDFSAPTPDFFSKNFTTWRGDAIPFTLLTKGDKRDETLGSASKEELAHKIDKLK